PAAFACGPTVAQFAELLSRDDSSAGPRAIALRTEGNRPPFFGVPTLGGGSCYRDLVPHLSKDQPFYTFDVPYDEGLRNSHARLAEAAEGYVAQLREIQPVGPYFLGGWSFGGALAFEMARRLVADGEEVALLALFDTHCPGRAEPHRWTV